MKQFTLPLKITEQRPIVYLEKFFEINAMLDTGSLFPVWVDNEKLLQDIGGIPVAMNKDFGGFGGIAKGTIYKIPMFHFGDLVFPEFPIIASKCKLPCQMLLSATMFHHLVYEVDDFYHKLNISIPATESYVRKLILKDEGGKLHILCTNGN